MDLPSELVKPLKIQINRRIRPDDSGALYIKKGRLLTNHHFVCLVLKDG